MTSGDEDAVMTVLTAHQHQGSLERRMEMAKAKLQSYRESSLLKKMEEFLKVASLVWLLHCHFTRCPCSC